MIDLTEEINLLEQISLPDSEESDEVEIIREYHPVRTIDMLLSAPHIGHPIHVCQDLPKVRYASSGVRELISRHLHGLQSGEAPPERPRKKPTKPRKSHLEIVTWFLVDDRRPADPEPIIPIVFREDERNPLCDLYTERWFECREGTQMEVVISQDEEPPRKRTNSVTLPPAKRPKTVSTAAPTVEEFLHNLLLAHEQSVAEQQRTVTLVLDFPPAVAPMRELTPAQKAELELEIRKHNRNNLNEFFAKILEVDIFSEDISETLPEIPLEFASAKQYIDTLKASFYAEMRTNVRSSAADLETKACLELRLQKEKDGFALLTPVGDWLLPSFRSYDVLLCVLSDNMSPWKPTKPLTRPSAFHFLGIVERLKENSLSAPVIKTKFTDGIRVLFTDKRERSFHVATIDGAVTMVRELRAIQQAEFTSLFPVLLSPREDTADQPLNISDGFFANLPATYNLSQIATISKVCKKGSGITLVQGPPGTGKTHTIVGLVSAFLCSRERWEKKPSVLVCAPSNNAVDEIALRVVTEGLVNEYGDRRRDVSCVRVGARREDDFGTAKKQPAEVAAITLGELVIERMGAEGRRDRGAAISALSGEIAKVGKSLLAARTQGQDALVLSLMKQQRTLHDKLTRERHEKVLAGDKRKSLEIEILNNSDVIFTTLAGARSKEMDKLVSSIDFVVIDEACQSVEPTSLIALQKQMRLLVLVGDPMQLPATISCQKAIAAGYGRSLFERLMQAGMRVTMLTEQYRMAPYIRTFSSQQFYNERLSDASSVITRKKPDWLPLLPLAFFDLQRSEEAKDPRSTSFSNPAEADFISEVVRSLSQRSDSLSLAVISPYRRQVQLLRDRISRASGVEIDTVDGFQGREKDAVIISTVRSEEALGFLTDSRRLNVAVTRARFGLWVVGSAKTLRKEEKWREFIRYCDENGCLRTCLEFRDVANLFRSRKGI